MIDHPVLSSTLLVAVSEMGDKTQLLAFALAARFRAPAQILAGILVATVLNHGLAVGFGQWVAGQLSPRSLALVVGLAFVAFGLWALKPDRLEEERMPSRFGAFLTTAGLFFVAEMGDKTQLATVALSARYQSPFAVTLGTTAGMMIADGLAVFAGERLAGKVRVKWIRFGAATLFFLFGAISLLHGART